MVSVVKGLHDFFDEREWSSGCQHRLSLAGDKMEEIMVMELTSFTAHAAQ